LFDLRPKEEIFSKVRAHVDEICIVLLTIFHKCFISAENYVKRQINMSDLDRGPFYTYKKAWDPTIETENHKVRWDKTFSSGRKAKSEALPDNGEYGIEFLLGITIPQFEQAHKEQEWDPKERYSQFLKVLNGTFMTSWEETLETDYPDDADRTNANWTEATYKFIKRHLNCKKSCDIMWRWMESSYKKEPLVPAEMHFHRFKELIRHSKRLPPGVKPDPTDDEIKEWCFRSFCMKHRAAFLISKTLESTTNEDICESMRLAHEQDFQDGMLHRLVSGRRREARRGSNSDKRPGRSSRHDASRNGNGYEKPHHHSARYQGREERKYRPARKTYRKNDRRRRDNVSCGRQSANQINGLCILNTFCSV